MSIIGAGRAGRSIGLALREAGFPITAVWSRSRATDDMFPGSPAAGPADAARAADVVVVAVPDDAIAGVATEAAAGVRAGALVFHTSGATSVEALAAMRDAGARTASAHPLQTLPDPYRGAAALRGAAVAVTCEPPDRAELFGIVRSWGGEPFELDDGAKTVYHAASVFASNYLVAGLGAAHTLLAIAGVPAGVLHPLVRASVDNALATGPRAALTGPAARGDVGTIARHLDAMPTVSMRDAYRAMAVLASELAGSDIAEAVR